MNLVDLESKNLKTKTLKTMAKTSHPFLSLNSKSDVRQRDFQSAERRQTWLLAFPKKKSELSD
jgi:hypothetical protein